MRKHFESGLAFMIVAMLSCASGLLLVATGSSGSGVLLLIAGGLWFIVAIATRKKLKATTDNTDSQDDGDA